MRIVFTTNRGAGHAGPVAVFARACARAGHDVLVAGPASARGLIARAELRFHAVGEPDPAEREAAWAPVWDLESAPGAAHVIQELFIGLDGRAALPGMLELFETHRPDLVVRETCEFASLIAAARLGVRQAQVLTCAPASLDAAPAPARLRRFRDPLNEQPREAANGGPPLVYVSFGSEAPRSRLFPDLYREVIHALAALPIRLRPAVGRAT